MNRGLLLQFGAAFLPVLVFVAVEEFYGVGPGMVVAILVTLAQFLVTRARTGVSDGFLLADLALISGLGGVSLLSGSDLFFKMKPAILQFLLGILLAAGAFARGETLERLATRYVKGARLNRHQLAHMRRLCVELSALTLLHGALIAWAALRASQGVWAFVSAGLFYILVALYLLKEWLARRRHYRTGPFVDLVDAAERPVAALPEGLLPLSGGALHRAVHLHLLSPEGELFLRETGQGRDVPLVEHVRSGETPERALARRLGDLPAGAPAPRLLFKVHDASSEDNEIVYGYCAVTATGALPGHAAALPGAFFPFARIRGEAATLRLHERLLREVALLEKIRDEARAVAREAQAEAAAPSAAKRKVKRRTDRARGARR